ncbi:MAG: tRNA (adenosine(37)-N6)-threonylcarbamoyltransferase complex ATPase subunit type 1 TsaE [Emcibacter sp.]|nr:tRNA (adenosine(37)-N6)-threonylcarbamoyltransferase complex ATPase subunit type 1 TsaE [Emcibacter sp.]
MQTLLVEIILDDLTATKKFATVFAPLLRKGDVVALDGALGAGKTELCRSVIHALDLSDDVPSPTFNLVQIYEPKADDNITPVIWHMDLYRLESPEEAFELGIEDAFDQAVSLIEWPSRLGPYLPQGFLTLRLEIGHNGEARILKILGDDLWKNRLKKIVEDK